MDLKLVIRDNVRTLLEIGPADAGGGVAKVMALGFANGTAQRILDSTTQIGVDKLGQLAAALKVEPWQLCVPDLKRDQMPTLELPSFRWPFTSIDPGQVLNLVGTAAGAVERGLLVALAGAGISPRRTAAEARQPTAQTAAGDAPKAAVSADGQRYFRPKQPVPKTPPAPSGPDHAATARTPAVRPKTGAKGGR